MAIRKEFAAVAAAFLVTSGVSWGSVALKQNQDALGNKVDGGNADTRSELWGPRVLLPRSKSVDDIRKVEDKQRGLDKCLLERYRAAQSETGIEEESKETDRRSFEKDIERGAGSKDPFAKCSARVTELANKYEEYDAQRLCEALQQVSTELEGANGQQEYDPESGASLVDIITGLLYISVEYAGQDESGESLVPKENDQCYLFLKKTIEAAGEKLQLIRPMEKRA